MHCFLKQMQQKKSYKSSFRREWFLEKEGKVVQSKHGPNSNNLDVTFKIYVSIKRKKKLFHTSEYIFVVHKFGSYICEECVINRMY